MIAEPRFMAEGYAIYGNAPFVEIDGKREQMHFGHPTGVKPDAPQWAHDEYAEYVKMQEQAKREGLKL